MESPVKRGRGRGRSKKKFAVDDLGHTKVDDGSMDTGAKEEPKELIGSEDKQVKKRGRKGIVKKETNAEIPDEDEEVKKRKEEIVQPKNEDEGVSPRKKRNVAKKPAESNGAEAMKGYTVVKGRKKNAAKETSSKEETVSEDVHEEDMPDFEIPSKDVPLKKTTRGRKKKEEPVLEDVHEEDMPDFEIPSKDVPLKTSTRGRTKKEENVSEDVHEEDMPDFEIPSKDVPLKKTTRGRMKKEEIGNRSEVSKSPVRKLRGRQRKEEVKEENREIDISPKKRTRGQPSKEEKDSKQAESEGGVRKVRGVVEEKVESEVHSPTKKRRGRYSKEENVDLMNHEVNSEEAPKRRGRPKKKDVNSKEEEVSKEDEVFSKEENVDLKEENMDLVQVNSEDAPKKGGCPKKKDSKAKSVNLKEEKVVSKEENVDLKEENVDLDQLNSKEAPKKGGRPKKKGAKEKKVSKEEEIVVPREENVDSKKGKVGSTEDVDLTEEVNCEEAPKKKGGRPKKKDSKEEKVDTKEENVVLKGNFGSTEENVDSKEENMDLDKVNSEKAPKKGGRPKKKNAKEKKMNTKEEIVISREENGDSKEENIDIDKVNIKEAPKKVGHSNIKDSKEENVNTKDETVASKEENGDSKEENMDLDKVNSEESPKKKGGRPKKKVDPKEEKVVLKEEMVASKEENVESKEENMDFGKVDSEEAPKKRGRQKRKSIGEREGESVKETLPKKRGRAKKTESDVLLQQEEDACGLKDARENKDASGKGDIKELEKQDLNRDDCKQIVEDISKVKENDTPKGETKRKTSRTRQKKEDVPIKENEAEMPKKVPQGRQKKLEKKKSVDEIPTERDLISISNEIDVDSVEEGKERHVEMDSEPKDQQERLEKCGENIVEDLVVEENECKMESILPKRRKHSKRKSDGMNETEVVVKNVDKDADIEVEESETKSFGLETEAQGETESGVEMEVKNVEGEKEDEKQLKGKVENKSEDLESKKEEKRKKTEEKTDLDLKVNVEEKELNLENGCSDTITSTEEKSVLDDTEKVNVRDDTGAASGKSIHVGNEVVKHTEETEVLRITEEAEVQQSTEENAVLEADKESMILNVVNENEMALNSAELASVLYQANKGSVVEPMTEVEVVKSENMNSFKSDQNIEIEKTLQSAAISSTSEKVKKSGRKRKLKMEKKELQLTTFQEEFVKTISETIDQVKPKSGIEDVVSEEVRLDLKVDCESLGGHFQKEYQTFAMLAQNVEEKVDMLKETVETVAPDSTLKENLQNFEAHEKESGEVVGTDEGLLDAVPLNVEVQESIFVESAQIEEIGANVILQEAASKVENIDMGFVSDGLKVDAWNRQEGNEVSACENPMPKVSVDSVINEIAQEPMDDPGKSSRSRKGHKGKKQLLSKSRSSRSRSRSKTRSRSRSPMAGTSTGGRGEFRNPKKSMKYIGAHCSITGGLYKAVLEADAIGAYAFGMFLKSSRQWAAKPMEQKHADRFIETMQEYGFRFDKVLPHGSYLMNCGSPNVATRRKSLDSLVDEMQRCETLGIKYYNFHPGSTGGHCTVEESVQHIADCINYAHGQTKAVVTVLENMCGQGHTIGGEFHELSAIIDLVHDKSRVGVCLDTCHAHAAGYDLNSPSGYEEMMDDIQGIIGLQYLKAVHVNDSQGVCGCHTDHHENIGQGKIKMAAFTRIMNDPRFDNLPMILETPGGFYDSEIHTLYGLIGKK